jgi:hypothetical protein
VLTVCSLVLIGTSSERHGLDAETMIAELSL